MSLLFSAYLLNVIESLTESNAGCLPLRAVEDLPISQATGFLSLTKCWVLCGLLAPGSEHSRRGSPCSGSGQSSREDRMSQDNGGGGS